MKNPIYSLTLLGIIVVCAGMYVFFSTQTVVNGVSASELEQNISDVSASVSEQEFEYIAIKNNINIAQAKDFGFEEITNARYITRVGNAQTLSSHIMR